jgi:hypothetical protein
MPTAIAVKRLNQKAAVSVGAFNGTLAILAIYDTTKMGYYANVTVFTGDVGNPSNVFTPANDDGSVKRFSSIAAILAFVTGAFLDIQALSIAFDNANDISKKFVVPADPVKETARLKVKFEKLKAAATIIKTKATAAVASAVTLGYDTSLNASVQAEYAELLKKLAVVTEFETYYQAQVTLYTV